MTRINCIKYLSTVRIARRKAFVKRVSRKIFRPVRLSQFRPSITAWHLPQRGRHRDENPAKSRSPAPERGGGQGEGFLSEWHCAKPPLSLRDISPRCGGDTNLSGIAKKPPPVAPRSGGDVAVRRQRGRGRVRKGRRGQNGACQVTVRVYSAGIKSPTGIDKTPNALYHVT